VGKSTLRLASSNLAVLSVVTMSAVMCGYQLDHAATAGARKTDPRLVSLRLTQQAEKTAALPCFGNNLPLPKPREDSADAGPASDGGGAGGRRSGRGTGGRSTDARLPSLHSFQEADGSSTFGGGGGGGGGGGDDDDAPVLLSDASPTVLVYEAAAAGAAPELDRLLRAVLRARERARLTPPWQGQVSAR
jgi:hypothetical protein